MSVCFVAGTHILTERGEVLVEQLNEGDRVVLHDGRSVPVKWLGRRTLTARQVAEDPDNAPIRIAAGAFGPNRPHRDLWISGDHAVGAHGVIMRARFLVNGRTIVQDLTERDITYHHVELDEHALLLSEGLATESFLEWGENRSFFANGDQPTDLRPDLSTEACLTRLCRPRVEDGPVFEEVQRLLLARAVELGALAAAAEDARTAA